MKKLFFCTLMCFSIAVFADVPIEAKILYAQTTIPVGNDCAVIDCKYAADINTEIADSTTESGGDTQADKITSDLRPTNNERAFSGPGSVSMLPNEVGWRSS